jgi:hypothetical protein
MNIDFRYPIGKFKAPEQVSVADRIALISMLRDLPAAMRMATDGLSESQLLTPYRDGGWAVAQVVHHVADSHMNAYIRFKLALTEDNPTIKPYEEALWAELSDGKSAEIEVSLRILEALHQRFVALMDHMNDSDWKRTYFHPALERIMSLEMALALYAWHSEHHLAHITQLRGRMDW